MSDINDKNRLSSEPALVVEDDNSNQPSTGVSESGRTRYSSIAMIDYFNAIERLCEEKQINPENVDLNFRVHWLRNAVGGSFARAQEMFNKYQAYVKEVPEEARNLDVPEPVKVALGDLISFITWHYRMSYTDIQNENVRRSEAYNLQLQEEIAQQKEQLVNTIAFSDELTLHNQALQHQLEQRDGDVNELQTKLSSAIADIENRQRQLDDASNEVKLLNNTCSSLKQQLGERKQEVSGLLEYQKNQNLEIKNLNTELTKQHSANNELSSKNEKLNQDVTSVSSERDRLREELNSAQRVTSEQADIITGKEIELKSLNKNLLGLQGERDTFNSELQKTIIVNQRYEASIAEKNNEMRLLESKVMKLEASQEAEKSVIESLKGTISTLTEALSGGRDRKG